jgi:hypothetical protein
MKGVYGLQNERLVPDSGPDKQTPGILKVTTWILAYAAWIFIFLIPIIGIILIAMYLLKNKKTSRDVKTIP